jgi:hypothetical protein
VASAGVVSEVSQTLVLRLKEGVPLVAGNVDLLIADDFDTYNKKPAVTVFLYHVAINGELRNGPAKLFSDGTMSPPGLPIELRYLLTPWAATPDDTHKILGQILQSLSAFASMSRPQLEGTSWEADDTVQLLPESLPVDEYHDIWDPSEIPYKLSISYMARVFNLDSPKKDAFAPVQTAQFVGPPP